RPSPQRDTHGPSLQSGSSTQPGLQPSPMIQLPPSSQGSAPSATPSPHTVRRHASPGLSHAQPGSKRQVELQPLPDAASPSSQVSRPTISPSPQVGRQATPAVEQVQPLSS